jgi:hypothetical protein
MYCSIIAFKSLWIEPICQQRVAKLWKLYAIDMDAFAAAGGGCVTNLASRRAQLLCQLRHHQITKSSDQPVGKYKSQVFLDNQIPDCESEIGIA